MTGLDDPAWPGGWCFYHERVHEPMEWGDNCQADEFDQQYALFRKSWELVEEAERDARARRWHWLRRVTLCWWKHRTARHLGPGLYVSHECPACARRPR